MYLKIYDPNGQKNEVVHYQRGNSKIYSLCGIKRNWKPVPLLTDVDQWPICGNCEKVRERQEYVRSLHES